MSVKFLGEKTKVGDSSSPFFTHKTDKNHFVNTTGSYVCIFVFAPLFLSLWNTHFLCFV